MSRHTQVRIVCTKDEARQWIKQSYGEMVENARGHSVYTCADVQIPNRGFKSVVSLGGGPIYVYKGRTSYATIWRTMPQQMRSREQWFQQNVSLPCP